MSDLPFGGFFPVPPEIAAQIKEKEENERLHTQDNTHAVKQLLDDLDQDQLRALDLIILHCGNAASVSYFRGRIEAINQFKFGACPCGQSHDPDEEFSQPPSPEQLTADHSAGLPEQSAVATAMDGGYEVHSEEWRAKCKEYGIALGLDADVLHCVGCGIRVASLADRMLRKPGTEGCTGCQQKSAWG
jgi:hypothetical protein